MGAGLGFTKKPKKLAGEELFEYAVKTLGARAYSTGDLRSRLKLRAARPEDVEAAIERLQSIGYLDDKRYAGMFASARVGNEGFGRLRVLNDLRTRRVPAKLAEEAVEEALEGRSEAELLDTFIERRMPLLRVAGAIEDERKLASAYRRLQRAGFTGGAILAALKRAAARPETLGDFEEESSEEELTAGDEPGDPRPEENP